MSELKIRCPVTGKSISVGVEVEPDGIRHLPDVKAQVLCPQCGQRHVWRKADILVEPGDGA
jgi:predicted RNA-binding Zn-ribbon protein involved in translation (DUF1610 family)